MHKPVKSIKRNLIVISAMIFVLAFAMPSISREYLEDFSLSIILNTAGAALIIVGIYLNARGLLFIPVCLIGVSIYYQANAVPLHMTRASTFYVFSILPWLLMLFVAIVWSVEYAIFAKTDGDVDKGDNKPSFAIISDSITTFIRHCLSVIVVVTGIALPFVDRLSTISPIASMGALSYIIGIRTRNRGYFEGAFTMNVTYFYVFYFDPLHVLKVRLDEMTPPLHIGPVPFFVWAVPVALIAIDSLIRMQTEKKVEPQ